MRKEVTYFTWIIYFFLFLSVIIFYTYRFKHPEMTEIELLLNFFTAIKDFYEK